MNRQTARTVLLSLLMLCTCLAFTSCTDSGSSTDPVDPWQTPRVNGIWITDETGWVTGSWGEPDGNYTVQGAPAPQGKLIPSQWRVYPPYPNPSDGLFNVNMTLPSSADVRITVVRATGPGETWEMVQEVSGATIPALNLPVYEANEVAEAGVPTFGFSLRSKGETSVPPGFYRCYFEVDGYSNFVDVFLYNECSELPPLMPGLEVGCND